MKVKLLSCFLFTPQLSQERPCSWMLTNMSSQRFIKFARPYVAERVQVACGDKFTIAITARGR
eukprot:648747-Hanusia_phi.AAC.1